MGARAPVQVCVLRVSFHRLLIITQRPAGEGVRGDLRGKALWLAASWQRASLRGVVLGVGGSTVPGYVLQAPALPCCTWYFYTNRDCGCSSAQPTFTAHNVVNPDTTKCATENYVITRTSDLLRLSVDRLLMLGFALLQCYQYPFKDFLGENHLNIV